MQAYAYDDRNVDWQTIEVIDAEIHVLAIDEALGIVDVLIRFEASTPGKTHRHLCDFSTLVLQGELRFLHPDGAPKELRPTGSYVKGVAHGPAHSEGAGDETAIVLFSFRGADGAMIEYLDDAGDVTFSLGLQDFKATLDQQIASGAAAKLGARPLS